MQQYADQATVDAEQRAASSRQAAAITPGSQPWDVNRRRLGRGRRHGRVPARHRRREGAAPRSRPAARSDQGIPDDGVAVPEREPRPPAGRRARARRRRVQHARPAVRPDAADGRLQEGDGLLGQHLHPQLDRRREAEPADRHPLRLGAGPRAGRQDQPVGPRLAALLGAGPQGQVVRRLRRGLAVRLQPTSRRTTIASIACSACRARRRTCRSCPTASTSAASS